MTWTFFTKYWAENAEHLPPRLRRELRREALTRYMARLNNPSAAVSPLTFNDIIDRAERAIMSKK